MTCEQALEFFANIPAIARKLQTLVDVGLGYIALGQSATTLSGGEAQRIKLSTELSRRPTGKTLYILDEPTTGLHMADVDKLLNMLHALVDAGNSMVVIEHNLDIIKNADWLIDMGPEGGSGGGQIVAEGTPEQVSKAAKSYTGQYLAKML
jgi:excinuclease ABC subunit A